MFKWRRADGGITYYDVISDERRWVEGEGQVKDGILISSIDEWEDSDAVN